MFRLITPFSSNAIVRDDCLCWWCRSCTLTKCWSNSVKLMYLLWTLQSFSVLPSFWFLQTDNMPVSAKWCDVYVSALGWNCYYALRLLSWLLATTCLARAMVQILVRMPIGYSFYSALCWQTDEVTGGCRKYHHEELHNLYYCNSRKQSLWEINTTSTITSVKQL